MVTLDEAAVLRGGHQRFVVRKPLEGSDGLLMALDEMGVKLPTRVVGGNIVKQFALLLQNLVLQLPRQHVVVLVKYLHLGSTLRLKLLKEINLTLIVIILLRLCQFLKQLLGYSQSFFFDSLVVIIGIS